MQLTSKRFELILQMIDVAKCFKCKVMHFGCYNPNFDNYMRGLKFFYQLVRKDEERESERKGSRSKLYTRFELGVPHSRNYNKRILGLLKKAFTSKDPDLWKNLFFSLGRPHLEYAVKV